MSCYVFCSGHLPVQKLFNNKKRRRRKKCKKKRFAWEGRGLRSVCFSYAALVLVVIPIPIPNPRGGGGGGERDFITTTCFKSKAVLTVRKKSEAPWLKKNRHGLAESALFEMEMEDLKRKEYGLYINIINQYFLFNRAWRQHGQWTHISHTVIRFL